MLVDLTLKYLTIEKYTNIYDRKLFESNYYPKYSGILWRIGFISYEMKLYFVEFLLLNLPESTVWLNLKCLYVIYLLRVLNLLYERYWPRAVNTKEAWHIAT